MVSRSSKDQNIFRSLSMLSACHWGQAMETLSIKSAYPPAREVLFSAHDGRLITVTLGTYDRSFYATKRLYLYPKAPELVRFFDEMAAEWHGWQGRKVFKSAEDDLRIEATADRMGHIQLRITISNDVPPPDDQWQSRFPSGWRPAVWISWPEE